MQGKLNEIDIRSILQLIELGQRTGGLFVETYGAMPGGLNSDRAIKPASVRSWFVFFLNGQIIYAGDSGTTLSRLRDYLRRYKLEKALDHATASAIATVNAPEYGYLWTLLENHVITPAQGRSMIHHMVRETLFDLLSLRQGAFIFELGPALAPQLTTLEIAALVAQIMKQVQEWKQFHPHIQSPDQCPFIANADRLRESLSENSLQVLERWVDGKTSLRQMSRYLGRETVTIARAIYPYVQQGLVQMLPPTEDVSNQKRNLELIQSNKVPRIVCIDDGATVRKTVETILHTHGYEASAISNPVKALSLVFHLKPDLILCDIAMPELDGYEICAMLRTSFAFRETPIIMLTGKDGFIDRVRARMVGATDYLTKPFGEGELLTLVEKYVGVGYPDRPRPDKLLDQALEDGLNMTFSESASTSA